MPKFKDYVPENQGGSWMNLEQGENKIRIVSGYVPYGKHYDNGLQKTIACIGYDAGCPYCEEAKEISQQLNEMKVDFGTSPDEEQKKQLDEVKKKYSSKKSTVQFLIWVIDRKDQQVKILRYGSKIQGQISQLAKSSDYSFDELPGYDMTIKREGQGLGTTYTVLADRKDSELTKEENELIQETIKPLEEIIDAMKNKAMQEFGEDDGEQAPTPTFDEEDEAKE